MRGRLAQLPEFLLHKEPVVPFGIRHGVEVYPAPYLAPILGIAIKVNKKRKTLVILLHSERAAGAPAALLYAA